MEILRGWLRFRRCLEDEGIHVSRQWLDGSFVEDKENDPDRGDAPGDVDVVTLVSDVSRQPPHWILNNRELKRRFLVDGFYIDLRADPLEVVDSTRYWLQLFSHARRDNLWKGLVEVGYSRAEDMVAARALGRIAARLKTHVR